MVLLLLGISVSRILYPFDVGHFEACVWRPALLQRAGRKSLYLRDAGTVRDGAIRDLYYLTVGLGLRLFGWQFWFGRTLTVFSAAVALWG
ncbi:MAG TPA: hypothetical protein VGB07_32765 [Blastocatellia bacterium]